ncbi:AAA family ATPase [Puniceibacterium sediminis]|uniref:AAA domain-containing protein n=1 Tax=Puniceibacterium sediminis TaxID=1608407 RepID=A0A238Z074_9RHOB|nr:AAA family ATPase [Puniceibacterium sediminis]SNR76770.1 AAA domain-containing protein [Puniceibacterium sediminis]
MIKIVSAHIEEFRGIRKLDINLDQKSFAISGPNGSGKSGVIDAIEFALTGQISRLTGTGTKGLSLSDHGPHVDHIKFPDAAFVELEVNFPTLGKSAKLTRKVSAPKKPKIEPNDPDIVSILDVVAQHPEITLARREILKFILVEPTKRSAQIQEILKIDELGQTRSALHTASSKLNRAAMAAEKDTQGKKNTLLQHLGIASLSAAEMLGAVNAKRELLGLAIHDAMTAETIIDQGLAEPNDEQSLNKLAALIELDKLTKMITGLDQVTSPDAEALVVLIEQLENDAQLLVSLQQRELVERGLKLVDGPACPMCDHEWPDEAHLLSHLHEKQQKSKAAGELKQKLTDHAALLSTNVGSLKALLLETHRIAKVENAADMLASVIAWGKDLAVLQERLKSFSTILELKDRLASGWSAIPEDFETKLKAFVEAIRAKPDQSATLAAQSFLINAEQRFKDYKGARKIEKNAQKAHEAGKIAYDAWCAAMESELDALYEAVEDDFSNFYRVLNDGDEQKFVARFKATEGRLDFDVNFYERGLFPPGAFHSEGHQDGMGVCLYLALMKRLLGNNFTVALLDDVVMSVDADHRYQFCKLLMTEFRNTQFVIATHDKVWAEQMRSAKLVTRKTSMVFDSWSVDTGPLVESNPEIWAEIDAALAKGKVEVAAPILRRHMEFVSRLLADQLGAQTVFRADNSYDLGGLLPSAMSRLSNLLGKAVDSAQSWGNEDQKTKAYARKKRLKQANTQKGEDDWTVNKAVHFNEWANFSPNDFKPIVQAFKDLLACAQCDDCGSWLYITPKSISPEGLRCSCNLVNLNLKQKPK